MSMLNEVRPVDTTVRDRSFMGRVKDIIPWKGDDAKEIIRKLIYIAAVVVLIYSAYSIYIYKAGDQDIHKDKDYLSNLFHQGEQTPGNVVNPDDDNVLTPPVTTVPDDDKSPDVSETDVSGEDTVPEVTPPVNSKYPLGMLPKYEALYDINPDIIGWLRIDGLTDKDGNSYIDYPVVQTTDNDYYLNHDFFGADKDYGTLFADYHRQITKDFTPQNTIIYGHNMGAGTYFSHLHDYKKRASFVSEHRLINYSTLYEENDYIIVGCFLIGIREDQDTLPLFRYHLIFDFNTIEDFDYWYQNVLYRSYYTTDIDCNMDDEYITLSTCSTEFYDSRFVVVARKLRDGEDPSVYNYYSNPKVRKPAAFYEAYGMKVPKDDGPYYQYYGKNNDD